MLKWEARWHTRDDQGIGVRIGGHHRTRAQVRPQDCGQFCSISVFDRNNARHGWFDARRARGGWVGIDTGPHQSHEYECQDNPSSIRLGQPWLYTEHGLIPP